MGDITLIHDVDVARRGDGSAPADLEGDYMDTWLDEVSSPFIPKGTAAAHKIGGNASAKGVPAGRTNGLYLYDLNYYLPAEATIVDANWIFYCYQRDNLTGMTFGVDRLTNTDWIEAEATWAAYRDPQDNGTADAGAPNDGLDDATKSWATNEWASKPVHIYGGTGSGQTRTVSSNTATRLTVSVNWTTNPDATSVYAVGDLWTQPGAMGEITTPSIAIANPLVAQWNSRNITAMVTDAWDNRDGICNFMCRRTDGYTAMGLGYFYHYTKNYYVTDSDMPPHLSITYTLDSKTFQVTAV